MEGQSKDLRGLTGHPLHFARELGSDKLHPGLAQMKGRGKVRTPSASHPPVQASADMLVEPQMIGCFVKCRFPGGKVVS